jgi:diaminohydroxyphosphoribosylaminopyrimidine deaminase / 5-amino-6-(5-phosphoribosylamino)uracil reductase
VSGRLEDELATLAGEGVRSLLLEGGPTLGGAFLAAGLVDKLLMFVAPTLSGAGPVALGPLPEPQALRHVSVERIGDDLLLAGYLREP